MFKQKAGVKSYMNKNTARRKIAKNDFQNCFFNLIDKSVFQKNHRKHKKTSTHYIRNNRKKKKLYSFSTKLSYNKVFLRKCITNRNEKKKQIPMKNYVYLGLSMLEISKMVVYEFWYD